MRVLPFGPFLMKVQHRSKLKNGSKDEKTMYTLYSLTKKCSKFYCHWPRMTMIVIDIITLIAVEAGFNPKLVHVQIMIALLFVVFYFCFKM